MLPVEHKAALKRPMRATACANDAHCNQPTCSYCIGYATPPTITSTALCGRWGTDRSRVVIARSSVCGATSGGQVDAGYATPLIILRLQSMEHRPPASGHCVQRRAHEGDVCSDMGCGQGFGYRHSPLNRMQYAVEWLAREAAR